MARFRLFLIGSPQPLDVDLPASNVAELNEIASRARFMEGAMVEPDEQGVCAGILFQTSRIQLAMET
jgi:hypothetical protein